MSQDPATDPAASGSAPAVALDGLAKRFGRTWALAGVELEVGRGETVAVVGPNGAGKSTLLRVLATLLKPTRGRASVLGADVADDPRTVRERTSFLAPEGLLYGDLTASENLRFAARMHGLGDRRGTAERALSRVGLEGTGDLHVDGFSSGMKRRLALARLLLRPGEVVLLDEPYASLDAEGIELVDALVEEMGADGRTVLVASHRWGRTLEGAERVVSLEAGRVAWTGPPSEAAGAAGARAGVSSGRASGSSGRAGG